MGYCQWLPLVVPQLAFLFFNGYNLEEHLFINSRGTKHLLPTLTTRECDIHKVTPHLLSERESNGEKDAVEESSWMKSWKMGKSQTLVMVVAVLFLLLGLLQARIAAILEHDHRSGAIIREDVG